MPDCTDEIKLEVLINNKSNFFGVSETRKYHFKDKIDDQKINYKRHFSFIDLDNLQNPWEFQYRLIFNDTPQKWISFKSKAITGQPSKIFLMGDHDLQVGMETIEMLEKKEFDVLILLGDYAYDIHTNNGTLGDEYFQRLEKLMTERPCILIPGNHEWVDNSNFLNARFKWPGTQTPEQNNSFYFSIGKVDFVTLNFDFYKENPEQRTGIINAMTQFLQTRRDTFKIFLSHRGLFCVRNAKIVNDDECWLNEWIFKEVEDTILEGQVGLVIASHDHQYTRMKQMGDFKIGDGYQQVLVGTGGTKHQFVKQDLPPNEFLVKEISLKKGALEMDWDQKEMKLKFISVENEVLDEFSYILQTNSENIWTQQMTMLIWILVLILILLGAYLVFYFGFKRRRIVKMENELNSLKPQMKDIERGNRKEDFDNQFKVKRQIFKNNR